MTTVPCFHVDAFAAAPFSGNPAAVCLLASPRPAKWMQSVAAEMNLSETAFVTPQKGGFGLRWFTPVAEVALCGHATLATAHVLWSEGLAPLRNALAFRTKSGVLSARHDGVAIELDFPARPARIGRGPAALAKALGQRPVVVAKAADDLLVELASEKQVRALQPDLAALGRLKVRGVIVTAAGDSRRHDFVSRFFGPAVGVPEDPVTGSAHCALAPYWGGRFGRTRMIGYQASARGGEVEVELVGDRVLLRGQAVTVVRGELLDGRRR
ncbi:MAG: PhzF family phenazine biosynthesis protein [Planctomycetes bacterium]|nr:PhzF family phenazine biosynthesis protein [Planctomycetota bacterium]